MGPEFFEIIEGAGFGEEDVDDDVAEVDADPVAFLVAFDAVDA